MKSKFIYLIIGLFIFIALLWLYDRRNVNSILEHPKYTTGIITSNYHYKTTFKPPGNDYIFYVNNIKHEGVVSTMTKCKNKNIGYKFLVIYDSLSNNNFASLCFYAIPDGIKAPPGGWRLDEVPIDIDIKEIEEYLK